MIEVSASPSAAEYHLLAAVPPPGTVDTRCLFAPPVRTGLSPLDTFIANTNVLNTIYLPYGVAGRPWLPEVGNLILLGYMSAVESYVRAIITGLINIDDVCRQLVSKKTVSFGLVVGGHDAKLLPEALLENHTFSTEGKIQEALRTFLGISKLSPELDTLDREFHKLCQVRHCCVHRFGKLGSQNALQLGFDEHKDAIEHPFSPSRADTEAIAEILQAYVKALNNHLFRSVLDRSFARDAPGPAWAWTLEADRERFSDYYSLFAMRAIVPGSPPLEEIYALFRQLACVLTRKEDGHDARVAQDNAKGASSRP